MAIEEVGQVVTRLSAEQFTEFPEWFEEYNAQRWDEQIEEDAKAGKLDELTERAKSRHRAGRTSPLS